VDDLVVGRVEGEDIEYYHHCGAISSTMFRTYLRSPREYWVKYVLGDDVAEEDTAALKFGRVAHGVILEGDEYVVLADGLDRRTKAGKEEYCRAVAECGNRHLLESCDGATLRKMLEYGIGKNAAAKQLIAGCREYETTYRAQHMGKFVQCRVDGLSNQYAIDLKTCRTVSGLLGDFFRRGYHIQAAWYNWVLGLCGEDPRDFEFIAVSKECGYECTVLEYGVDECKRVWENVCVPVWHAMLRSMDTGVFENKYGDVMAVTTPERMLHG
jgi:hypothetical protein